MERKPITQLTDEELLKDLDSAPEINNCDLEMTAPYKNDVIGFIHAYKIEDGPHRINKKTLYRLYRFWSENPISQNVFGLELGEVLIVKSNYYHINRDVLKVKLLINELRTKRLSTKIPSYKKHFDTFMKKYYLEAGDFYVNGDGLYFLYDKWIWKTRIRNPITRRAFNEFLGMYFDKKQIFRGGKVHWYYGVTRDITNYLTRSQLDDPASELINKDVTNEEKSKKSS